jgi:RluA family pseudouridine synthase
MMSKRFNPQRAVIWSDEHLLVVQKPSGHLSIPDGYDPYVPHLVGLLEPTFGDLWVVHRLDRDTSGVILFARSADAHRALNQQFENRQVTKIYHALIIGKPGWKEQEIDLPLLPDGDRHHRTTVNARRGKPASTTVRVLETFKNYSLIEAQPHTGYTHQIRAHLSNVGYPIVADTLYGDSKPVFLSNIKPRYRHSSTPEEPLLERTALHAWSLEVLHPINLQNLSFQAPYPKDLSATVSQLRKHS